MPNTEALYETLAKVISVGEGHQQDLWVSFPGDMDQEIYEICGTAACFAGWRCIQDGYIDPVQRVFPPDIGLDAKDRKIQTTAIRNPRTRLSIQVDDISEYARERFGLTDKEAAELFCADNTLSQITDLVARITGREADGLREAG